MPNDEYQYYQGLAIGKSANNSKVLIQNLFGCMALLAATQEFKHFMPFSSLVDIIFFSFFYQ